MVNYSWLSCAGAWYWQLDQDASTSIFAELAFGPCKGARTCFKSINIVNGSTFIPQAPYQAWCPLLATTGVDGLCGPRVVIISSLVQQIRLTFPSVSLDMRQSMFPSTRDLSHQGIPDPSGGPAAW